MSSGASEEIINHFHKYIPRFQSKPLEIRPFSTSSSIHVWNEDMGSGRMFGMRTWDQVECLE